MKITTPAQLWIAAAGLLVAGLGAGSAVTWLFVGPLQPYEQKIVQALPGTQASGLVMQSSEPTALLESPEPVSPTQLQAAPAEVKPSERDQQQSELKANAIAPSKAKHKPDGDPSRAQRPTQLAQEVSKATIARPGPASSDHTSPPPAAAVPATPEQRVSMQQAGIAGLNQAAVHFVSGRVVQVGSTFPSGETLLSVDPGQGRIVTDRRVIVVSAGS